MKKMIAEIVEGAGFPEDEPLELWNTVVEPRAKRYAQTYADRIGAVDE